MKAGDKITCPACGESCFAQKKSIMDGWTKIGDSLVCSLCGYQLLERQPDEQSDDSSSAIDAKKSALAELLGGVEVEKPVIESSADERIFCRDCCFFISHPFMSRCSHHNREVGPMDDCSDFAPRK